MIQLEKWYIANIREKNDVPKWRDDFERIGIDKSFMILTGVSDLSSMPRNNHLRYLWRFNHKDAIDTVIERINKAQLWVKPIDIVLNNFEELYKYVVDKVNTPEIKFIGQLAIYDISIHLALLWNEQNLIPKDYVYLHALPERAYRRLVKEGIIKKLSFKNGNIKTTDLRPYFPTLHAYEIEDLLCHIGKAIRELDKRGSKVTIANIFKSIEDL